MNTAVHIRKPFDVAAIRAEFPALQQRINGQPLVYFDNAATSQKPLAVIEAISDYYRHDNANVHRAVHTLAARATGKFEAARRKVADFINSPGAEQVLWTRGTTEAINLVANSWGGKELRRGERVLMPVGEHHSSIVPWQMVAQRCGAEVLPVAVTPQGEIDLQALDAQLDERVRMVVVGHISNALGTVNPLPEIISRAHAVGARVLVDGAQAVAHGRVDMQALDADFYAFSGHKMFGPTGIGVLWGRRELLQTMPPWQGGGEMIDEVRFAGTTYQDLPYRFEAGTPDIAGAIGLGAAVDWLQRLDHEAVAAHEASLLQYARQRAAETPGLRRIGEARQTAGVFSFLLDGIAAADVGTLLDEQGIAVRVGHHCAQPLLAEYGIAGTVRASFALYNTHEEVDRLFAGIDNVQKLLSSG